MTLFIYIFAFSDILYNNHELNIQQIEKLPIFENAHPHSINNNARFQESSYQNLQYKSILKDNIELNETNIDQFNKAYGEFLTIKSRGKSKASKLLNHSATSTSSSSISSSFTSHHYHRPSLSSINYNNQETLKLPLRTTSMSSSASITTTASTTHPTLVLSSSATASSSPANVELYLKKTSLVNATKDINKTNINQLKNLNSNMVTKLSKCENYTIAV